MEDTVQHYTLQLRVVTPNQEGLPGPSVLEVVAYPALPGQSIQGRFSPWEPVLESICTWINASAFHRKATQRTLAAGLPAYIINRETGSKHLFTAEQIARLSLTADLPQTLLGSDLSTAA